MGAKGGVGQTLTAVNFSIALAQEGSHAQRKKVILLDANLALAGEIGLILNIQQTKSLVDLLNIIDKLTPQLAKGYVISHNSGIDFLPVVNDFSEAGLIQPSHIEKAIQFFSAVYDYVIVNISRNLNDTNIAVLDNTDAVFLITVPELAALYHARRIWQNFIVHHFPTQMLKVVLNKHNINSGLSDIQAAEYIKQKIMWKIPYDADTCVSSINRGVPAVISASRSPYSRAVGELAEFVIKAESDPSVGFFTGVREAMEQTRREHRAERQKKELAAGAGGGARDGGGVAGAMSQDGKEGVAQRELVSPEVRNRIYEKLIKNMKEKRLEVSDMTDQIKIAETKALVREEIENIINQEAPSLPSRFDRTRLVLEILDQALGLGPLEDLLRDPSITEIMVNGKDKIYIERAGKIFLSNRKFTSDQQLMNVIERIVTPLGRRIDEASPLVDGRLKDGSRVNAIIPPLSLVGPCITIRKFSKERLTFKDLIKFNSLTPEMVEFMRVCVLLRKNILISGGTGSGKTTLLNILASFIPTDERIVTIEDAAELQLPQEHWVRLESRPPNIEGAGEITIRRLVINSLRMRPDRIVVGECRAGEALDMLQAMNTGHDGSLTTVHANSARESIARLETLVLMAGMDMPIPAIRSQIAGAIDVIIQQSRFSDGTRKIVSITEITGMEKDTITLAELFKFEQTGVDEKGKVLGEFKATGVMPSFIDEVKSHNIPFDLGIFSKVH